MIEQDDELVGLVAGVLSTHPPHDREHPEKCLPMARDAVRVMREQAASALTALWDDGHYFDD